LPRIAVGAARRKRDGRGRNAKGETAATAALGVDQPFAPQLVQNFLLIVA
jgi:hypothetical protein